MKALILCGKDFREAFGGINLDKSLLGIPFGNKSIMELMIEALRKVEVEEVILALCFESEYLKPICAKIELDYDIKITMVREETPLGTGGAIKNSEKLIRENNEKNTFFVCNADLICKYPFAKMIDTMDHLLSNKATKNVEGIMCLRKAHKPSKYGVVKFNENSGKILEFQEKPQQFITNYISTGFYLLTFKAFDRLKLEK